MGILLRLCQNSGPLQDFTFDVMKDVISAYYGSNELYHSKMLQAAQFFMQAIFDSISTTNKCS